MVPLSSGGAYLSNAKIRAPRTAKLPRFGNSASGSNKYVERLIGVADHHTIINRGRLAWQGTSAALSADSDLWHRHLGV